MKVPPPQSAVVVPVMVPGCEVLAATERDLAAEDPQAELAVTLTVPEAKVAGKVTETEFVP